MAVHYYRNENKYFVEVPIYTNGSITVNPGEFVKGSSFVRQAALGIIVDKGEAEPAEVTANPTLLVFVQDEDAGEIVGSSIQTDEIDNLAITTGKLADLSVTTGKLNDLAVTEGKIANLAVTNGKLGLLSVAAGQIAADAVVTAKIQNQAVTSTKVAVLGTPTAADDAGLAGNIKFDGTYIYLCTGTDTWIRFAHTAATW